MNKIHVAEYFNPDILDNLPEYTITPNEANSYRIEWEDFYLGDSDVEKWAIITYNRENKVLFIDFEYNTFQFNVIDFDDFFRSYFEDVQEFVLPLNKRLSPDIEESLRVWEKAAFEYFLDEKITDKEYVDVVNFFRTKCYIQAPSIVIENTMMESPLLNSLFKKPTDLFPVMYGYPFCTRFFLKFIMPILYDAIETKKLFQ